MAAAFPYAHYSCPCSEAAAVVPSASGSKRASILPTAAKPAEDSTFDPHDPRANFSLYPLDSLLYCNECDAIRCPRCSTEEVINWYCPNCLFEVPSSAVRGDDNRCSRNCYNCPACSSPLAVTAVPTLAEDYLKPTDAASEEYMLQCLSCDWSSLDVNVRFGKPTKITEQLSKQRKARIAGHEDRGATAKSRDGPLHREEAFANLTTFYKEQLADISDPQNPFSNSPYSSPANLARIMSLYGGLSASALKKSREKPQPMREARTASEGLSVYHSSLDQDKQLLQQVQMLTWDTSVSCEQRHTSPVNYGARSVDQLWPIATHLRTKVGKRCKTCRQFISRPDPKVGNLRYRIRLLALNHVPRLLLKPLAVPVTPLPHPSFRLRDEDPVAPLLQPLIAQQYILTIRNPIFDTIKVTLATPAVTPGKVTSRVTILCPSFTIGPAGDVWDEALSASHSSGADKDGGRKAAMASLTGSSDADRQPEAGKIWERTRNSTSVILEIVPGQLEPPPSIVPRTKEELAALERDEDDDILEVPIYVRTEWEATIDDHTSDAGKDERKTGEKVSKELAYWCVLGLGRIG